MRCFLFFQFRNAYFFDFLEASRFGEGHVVAEAADEVTWIDHFEIDIVKAFFHKKYRKDGGIPAVAGRRIKDDRL